MAQQSGAGIEDIYKGVITDVISQVREAFLDEGVDIDVLQQLKKSWEAKVQTSGAVDLEGSVIRNIQPVPPPNIRHPQSRAQSTAMPPVTTQQATNLDQLPSDSTSQTQSQSVNPNQMVQPQQHYSQPIATVQNQVPILGLSAQMFAQRAGVQIQPGMSLIQGAQYALVDGPNGRNLIFLNAGQLPLNLDAQQFIVQQAATSSSNISEPQPQPRVVGGGNIATKTEPGTQIPQLDGGGTTFYDNSYQSSKSKKAQPSRRNNQINEPTSSVKIAQLDGGGPGMTDTSSEDEEDPMSRYAGLEEDAGQQDEGEQEEEDEPLNSGDDQSDDEDLDTLFDADNVVVCQFEKVHRARNRWKFNLKDGVMQLRGKDYCFHKSTGEAEW